MKKKNTDKDLTKKINNIDNNKYFENLISERNAKIFTKIDSVFFNFNKKDLSYAVNYFKDKVILNKENKKYFQDIFTALIVCLYKLKMYYETTLLIDNINYKVLDYAKLSFPIALAFTNLKNYDKAQDFYEKYLEIYPNDVSSLNNLGNIYKLKGNLDKALIFYGKANEIDDNEVTRRNLEKCKNVITDRNKDLEAVELFNKDNIWIMSRVKLFYKEANDMGHIICPYKKLPYILKCNEIKAQEILNYMIEKRYIKRITEHLYDTYSSVYSKNIYIEKRLDDIEKENNIISYFIHNLDDFSLNTLEKLDYFNIIIKLDNIRTNNIKKIIIRDYNELVFNYLSKQKKTIILLSGSIIELILLYILDINDITSYKVGLKKNNKKIMEMDITELLEVCNENKLLHPVPEKFIDGFKYFRNFIHPGKEIRDNYLELNDLTTQLAFNLVNWLILNLEI